MSFSKGGPSIKEILESTTEEEIASYYLGIKEIPCVINSPLRLDRNPSFGIYYSKTGRVYYKDFSNKESGSLFDLLSLLWKTTLLETLNIISNDLEKFSTAAIKNIKSKRCYNKVKSNTTLQCKVREWKEHDVEYWKSFGISLKWLKYAEVYPISHILVSKEDSRYTITADKYAYAYVEHKEGNTTLKIYQPFNDKGFKWKNKHDRSVISLWTKIPKKGDNLCICASLKDALCLWANCNIPAIAVQGEGYNMSETAIKELKNRYKNIYILFDNDEAGLIDGEKLSKSTGFTNIVLPNIDGCKDISDLFKHLKNKKQFQQILLQLFKN